MLFAVNIKHKEKDVITDDQLDETRQQLAAAVETLKEAGGSL